MYHEILISVIICPKSASLSSRKHFASGVLMGTEGKKTSLRGVDCALSTFSSVLASLVNLVPRVFRLFGQRGNAGKTLGTSNFITAGFLR